MWSYYIPLVFGVATCVGDLGEVMTFSWVSGRSTKLPVYGPKGVHKVVNGFRDAYALDATYRVAHHAPLLDPNVHGFTTILIPSPKGSGTTVVYEDGSEECPFKIQAFEVNHFPVKPAYGFRVTLNDQVVAISGDTCKCDSLIENCKGAHIVVQEALCCEFMLRISDLFKEGGNDRNAKLVSDVVDYHTSIQECIDIADICETPVMALTHLVPAPDTWVATQYFFQHAVKPPGLKGNVLVGEDGLILRINSSANNRVDILSPGRHSSLNTTWILSFVLFVISIVYYYMFGTDSISICILPLSLISMYRTRLHAVVTLV